MSGTSAQADALVAWASAEYAAGREAAAEGGVRAALALAPGNLAARHLLAACRVAAGALTEGAKGLAEVLAEAPGNDEARLHLAAVLAQLGRHKDVVALLDETVRLRPDFLAACQPLAVAHWELGARDAAVGLWRHLAARQPENGAALVALGHALWHMGGKDEAEGLLRRAVALLASTDSRAPGTAPELPAARVGLAELLMDKAADAPQGDALVAEAVAQARMALAGPCTAAVLVRCGSVLHHASERAEAEACYDAALALEPGRQEPRMFRGMLQLLRGDLEGGWPCYEARRLLMDHLGPHRDPPESPWRVPADLRGQTVRVVLEQGIGDCMQFARYLPMLAERGARVEVVPHLRTGIVPLLRQMAAVAGFVEHVDTEPLADVVVPLLTLPLAFGTTLASIPAALPYLAAPEKQAREWRTRLVASGDPRPRVGVVWWGNAGFANDRRRSMPLARIAPLLRRRDVAFHVLAPTLRDGEDAEARALATVHDGLHDYADTAALVEQMDLVVSVDTSVAHLAGALGRKVWIMLPYEPDWRWLLGREDTPWYPTARLFRQSARGDWDGVVSRIHEALDATFG